MVGRERKWWEKWENPSLMLASFSLVVLSSWAEWKLIWKRDVDKTKVVLFEMELTVTCVEQITCYKFMNQQRRLNIHQPCDFFVCHSEGFEHHHYCAVLNWNFCVTLHCKTFNSIWNFIDTFYVNKQFDCVQNRSWTVFEFGYLRRQQY